jgi:Effector-associated domain 7/NB-ARC domain/TIR domain
MSSESTLLEVPRIFISYSHNTNISDYKDRILALADRLREDGVDAKIDQYKTTPPEGWPRWVLNQVEWADFVLVACSEEYDRRFRGNEAYGKGKGGTWEGGVIIQELYDAQGNNSKFIPIVLNSEDSKFIPSSLRGTTYYRLDANDDYDSLYRYLTNQPETPEPPVRKLKQLPPRDRKQDLSPDSSSNSETISQPAKPLLSEIRQLVEDALSNDELINLCYDFPKVYNQFTTGQTKTQRIRLLIEYVQRQREESKLLTAIESLNPNAYARFIDNTRNRKPEQPKEPCNLPRKSYTDFIGRKKEIAELLKRISPEYRQHITVISGIGGVGKTALAVEVASQCWNAKKNGNNNNGCIPVFNSIIFTSSKTTEFVNTQILNRPEKEAQLTDIFRLISDVLDEPTITQVLATEQHRKVKEVLSKQSTLLIIDNMETLSDSERSNIVSFLNDVPQSTQVLITTREYIGYDSIQIDSLTRKESYDLLTNQINNKDIKTKDINDKDWRVKIYNRFRGIPIALIYAVGKLAAGYQLAEIVDPKITSTTGELGKFYFESSIEGIRKTPSYQLLMTMAFFDKPPCREALTKVAGLTDGNSSTAEAIVKLKQLSLITEEKGRYEILPITLEYVIQELETIANNQFKLLARERWYEWYFEFTKQYGGLDWEGWRARYDRLEAEWKNIESVLNWYAEKAEWMKVLQLWQNVDNYADLSGYWQDRRYWWALLGKNFGSAETKVKALSEKGFTLTLMGTEYYNLAEEYLNNAWDLCKDVDDFGRATVANHLAVLEKVRGNHDRAHYWLDKEENLLRTSETDREQEKKRYQVRNIYYRAETNYLQDEIGLARDGFELAIKLTREIGWQRFRNYSKNILAEIYIRQDNLESAETLLKAGFSSATQAKENRRIALYYASYARFYYKSAQKARQDGLSEESRKFIDDAKKCADKALKVFSKELMIAEKNEIIKLIESIDRY